MLLLALSATCLVLPAFADGEGAGEAVIKEYNSVEIMAAKGGANGIVSMTFDDSHMPTAEVLNQLFEEYGLKGSLMMITDKMINTTNTVEKWNEVFAKGYLEPQSHSALHLNLSNGKTNTNDPNSITHWENNNGNESMYTEIEGSQSKLNTTFPNYDCITFAIPNSNYHTPADELLAKTYHASRGGGCPFTAAGIQTGLAVQTLDPKVGYAQGNWSNLQIARLTPNQDGIELSENLEYLETCAENGGWYISMTHAVFEPGKEYSGIHNDCSVADLETFCAAVSEYVKEGKIWCTTMSEATKYIRERQNSTVRQYATESGIYVDLTMTATTKDDNLALDADVFNVPLTVKVELPYGWSEVTVSQGESSTTYSTFIEGGVTFAYIELVPNGGTASLVNENDSRDYINTLTIYQNLAVEEQIGYNIYIPTESLVESVSVNGVALSAAATDKFEGYSLYTVDSILVADAAKQLTFTIGFTKDSNLDPYMFNTSVLGYLSDVGASDATVAEKQLCFDFATYLKDAYVMYMAGKTADTAPYDAAIASYVGFTLTTPNLGEAADNGNLDDALTGVSFALNEKPYYLIHIDSGFYGTVTVTLGNKTETYEVVNGYYHGKSFVIFEVDGLCDLLNTVSISAVGGFDADGEATVNVSGFYNVANYYENVKVDGVTPAYAGSLAAYITSAKAYLAV